jgi:hypothetical protein
MNENWYEVVEGSIPLTQGDLVIDCPLIGWTDKPLELVGSGETETLKGATTAIRADVVVMTQACDLEYSKVPNVILCPHLSLTEYRREWEQALQQQSQNPTNKAWRSHCNDICDGFMWNLTILNAGASGDLQTDHRIVDFHEVYTIPRSFLESLLRQRNKPRLRLLPPYREHLSQAFARFFMRVGLPAPVARPW